MFIPVGLALGALSGVSSLIESAAAGLAKGGGNDPLSALAQAFTGDQPAADPVAKPAGGPLDSGTLATLISLQGQSGPGGSLFATIDTDSNGSISKSEFESALAGAGVDTNSADNVFTRLDADGDGSISQSELSSRAGYHHRQHAVGTGASWLLNAVGAEGATTQTTTNANNSTTTTISYTDGSTVSTTTPASGGSATPNVNLLEQLIKLQAQLVSPPTGTTTAVV